MLNEYDEIKNLLRKSKLLQEQSTVNNLAKSIERSVSDSEKSLEKTDSKDVKKEKSRTYRISGGLLTFYGETEKDLLITGEEKTCFQETMDDFVTDVSDLADFGVLKVYKNEVQWSGRIIDANLEFFFTVGQSNGVYINGDMIKLDDKLNELSTKLTSFFEKFKSKWAKVIGNRKKTKVKKEE